MAIIIIIFNTWMSSLQSHGHTQPISSALRSSPISIPRINPSTAPQPQPPPGDRPALSCPTLSATSLPTSAWPFTQNTSTEPRANMREAPGGQSPPLLLPPGPLMQLLLMLLVLSRTTQGPWDESRRGGCGEERGVARGCAMGWDAWQGHKRVGDLTTVKTSLCSIRVVNLQGPINQCANSLQVRK